MKYTIAAHPTMYHGVQYRSRLEARYAVFFDLLGWKFEYEPCDLNGWSPDFAILGAKDTTLVEVKPYTRIDEARETQKRIELAVGDECDVLLAGAFCEPAYFADGATCGWLYESENRQGWGGSEICGIHGEDFNKGWMGLIHTEGSYADRISGVWDGDHHLTANNILPHEAIYKWREAGNIVQWKP